MGTGDGGFMQIEYPLNRDSLMSDSRIDEAAGDSSCSGSASSSTTDPRKEDRDGCSHYRRKARLVTPCCDKVYTCRLCHDDAESHAVDRHKVEEMVCSYCDTRQPVQQNCAHCDTRLGWYYCKECRMHDDTPKGQYHCAECGICRAGGRKNYFHCPNCDICLPNHMQDKHKCVNGVGRSDCGVCLEDIHSSRSGGQVLPCGHLLHVACYQGLIRHGIGTCPKCKASIKNREREWARMDAEIRRSVVPAEFRRSFVEVLCCDCHETTRTKYHIIGLKCCSCGSYNTAPTGPVERQPSHGISSLISGMRRMMSRVN